MDKRISGIDKKFPSDHERLKKNIYKLLHKLKEPVLLVDKYKLLMQTPQPASFSDVRALN